MNSSQKKAGRPPKQRKILPDDYVDKPLSSLISEIKNLMKPFPNTEVETRIREKKSGKTEVEIRVRILTK